MSEFIELVEQMRTAQNRYFKERSQASLVEARILERKVDVAIQRIKADAAAQREREEEVPW